MGIPEFLVVIALVAGFAKFQIDLVSRLDERMDRLAEEILILSHKIDTNHRESRFNNEVIESRLNMMLNHQTSFMDKVVCKYEHLKEDSENQ